MRVHLVDGTFELFRAHFSPRPGKAVGGVDVKATAGVVASMLALLEDAAEAVTHLAIAFDNPIVSFRNELFDGYKTDEGIPTSLRAQFDLVEVAARALGIVVWSMNRWEADDALATAATRFAGPDVQVRILTPDKDLGQVLEGDRIVQVDRIRRKVIDEAAMRARRGVSPKSIPDLLALMGDTSDGIPGIPGFGEKSSAALLARYETIEAIPDDAGSWDVKVTGAPRLAATLASRRSDALLYKRLATLVRDVPLEQSLADLEYKGARRSSYEALCSQLEITPRWTRFVD
ncbi:MAG TPA: 5'-3' exonuclease H3TH domain-containing protein [Labilithrix sp.]|jgi:5'-3' exonuclease|nr:5'-3' exonuclease H3TH domain-containing protein [Labilithrix sp.]